MWFIFFHLKNEDLVRIQERGSNCKQGIWIHRYFSTRKKAWQFLPTFSVRNASRVHTLQNVFEIPIFTKRLHVDFAEVTQPSFKKCVNEHLHDTKCVCTYIQVYKHAGVATERRNQNESYQVIAKNCNMQNNNAKPFLFHYIRNRTNIAN